MIPKTLDRNWAIAKTIIKLARTQQYEHVVLDQIDSGRTAYHLAEVLSTKVGFLYQSGLGYNTLLRRIFTQLNESVRLDLVQQCLPILTRQFDKPIEAITPYEARQGLRETFYPMHSEDKACIQDKFAALYLYHSLSKGKNHGLGAYLDIDPSLWRYFLRLAQTDPSSLNKLDSKSYWYHRSPVFTAQGLSVTPYSPSCAPEGSLHVTTADWFWPEAVANHVRVYPSSDLILTGSISKVNPMRFPESYALSPFSNALRKRRSEPSKSRRFILWYEAINGIVHTIL